MKTFIFIVAAFFQFSAHADLLNSNELANLPKSILKHTTADKIINIEISTAYLKSIGSVVTFPLRFIADGASMPVSGHLYDLQFTAVKGKDSIVVNCIAYDLYNEEIMIDGCKISTKYRSFLVEEVLHSVQPFYNFSYRQLND
jgi:hypothetical protein